MNHIDLTPLLTSFGQFLIALICCLLTVLLPKLLSYVSIKLTDAQWAVVDRTAEHCAKQLWAEAEASIATASITVGDPRLQKFVQLGIEAIPDVLSKLGLTPEQAAEIMAKYIVAHLGGLQAPTVVVSLPSQTSKASGK